METLVNRRKVHIMKEKLAAIVFVLASVSGFGQESSAVPLDRAISGSMTYLTENLERETIVAVLNFAAPPDVSHYVIEELTAFLVNNRRLIVVDRRDLEALQEEMDFQLSVEVSDESAQSIGKKLGAQTIISGSLTPIGNVWRMRVKALEVETARIQGVSTHTVQRDRVLSALLPKTTGDKIGTGALNIVFGLGSYMEGDISGGFTLTAGFLSAAVLFAIEAAALDWDNPAVGVPATIGVSVAGLSLAYSFARPFIYNRSPKLAAIFDKLKLDAASAPENGMRRNFPNTLRLSYSFNW